MRDIRIAAAQFEHRDGDKAFNLDRIDHLAGLRLQPGAQVVSFHEGAITAYSFLQAATRDELLEVPSRFPTDPVAEPWQTSRPDTGAGVGRAGRTRWRQHLQHLRLMTPDGPAARFRKIHAFLNPHLSSGSEYCVFDLWVAGSGS
ncbi:MAG: hypothetical protein Ct9H300mP1_39090 [Planctomycetaceae bacterium]|nr:MAG: hypothetical protein Ct9H300mP1_39090 [Planctomycetaceae bacterium]